MLAWRAARTAARSRGLVLGSGRPERAAVVNSRMILVKTLPRFLSCAPLRYMMFLNCEWPAIVAFPLHEQGFSRASPPQRHRQLSAARGVTSQYGRIAASLCNAWGKRA